MSAPAVAVLETAQGKPSTVFAAWMDQRKNPGDLQVYWSTLIGDGGQIENRPVAASVAGDEDHPALAIDANNVFAAWESHRGEKSHVRVRQLGTEGVEKDFAEDGGSALFPSIAAKAGAVVVAYERLRDGKRDVVVRRVPSAPK
ncbi:MAG: hypothetical protein ACKVX7_11355 [Planctomycetota bacterium]